MEQLVTDLKISYTERGEVSAEESKIASFNAFSDFEAESNSFAFEVDFVGGLVTLS